MSPTPKLVEETEVIDPVCGMRVLPSRAASHVEHEGHTYYFCGLSCANRFRETPDAFLDRERDTPKGAGAPSHTRARA